ncbi:MAG: hypothetical protein ABJD07_10515 [Gemmatimonadaceae bacterium]
MILVLASIIDEAAASFARELASDAAASLITCADLASAPLNVRHPDFDASTITVRGESWSVARLAGVVNLLPAVFPDELVFYDEGEREYQAAEIHALLTFFLSSLACPVINRATAASLTGPFLNPLGWRHLMRSVGTPLARIDITSDAFANPFLVSAGDEPVEVACLGQRVITPSLTDADARTLALASAGGVDYLRAVYLRDGDGGVRFLSAHTTPDVKSAATRAAIADYFAARRR